jgi:hypothetical protein
VPCNCQSLPLSERTTGHHPNCDEWDEHASPPTVADELRNLVSEIQNYRLPEHQVLARLRMLADRCDEITTELLGAGPDEHENLTLLVGTPSTAERI